MLTRTGTVLRWATGHGLARAGISAAARRGDPQARFFMDPAVRHDPYPFYREIREMGPLVSGRLMWSTARHDVAAEVLRSDAFGVAAELRPTPAAAVVVQRLVRRGMPIGPMEPPSMLAVDPPDHTRYRRLVSKVFTHRAIEELRPAIERASAELLDTMSGEVDLISRYASVLPVTVIAQILGVPLGMRTQFVAWGQAISPVLDVGLPLAAFRRTEQATRELNDWLRGHFERLRADPGDDLLSRLVHLDSDGDRLSTDELLAVAGLILGAGFETTANLLGTGTHLLMRHRDQLDLLRADPAAWRNAVEEILRYDTPVQNTARFCRTQSEVAGVTVRPRTVVVTLLGGANRDPAVFTDPDRFDITRANAREHLSFSSGRHFCLGAALARLEGEVGLRTLFDRYPEVTPCGEPHRRSTRVLRGYDVLPVNLRTSRRIVQA